tara:strand:- start:1728 stop:1889 length:162 start_codon:yes stop_codon:yes gene_type:complete
LKDLFDMFSDDDYSRIRSYTDDDECATVDVDDSEELDITQLEELDTEGMSDEG